MQNLLKIMEWNINQRLNHSKKDMPEWIAEVISNKDMDIVVLTEWYKGNNWEVVKKNAFNYKYTVFESSNNGINNDVAIAINTEKLTPIYAKSYFSFDHNVPDHLEVKCKTKNNIEVMIVGIRIHATASDQEKEKELNLILNGLKDENIVVICGDFNNNRRGFSKLGYWHLSRIDELINNEFVRMTPSGSSIYVENTYNIDYEFAEDHFLIKGIETKNIELKPYDRSFCDKDRVIYKWKNDFQKYLGKDQKGKNIYDCVPDPYPDHAILTAIIEI